jgi:hypothetical protein
MFGYALLDANRHWLEKIDKRSSLLKKLDRRSSSVLQYGLILRYDLTPSSLNYFIFDTLMTEKS